MIILNIISASFFWIRTLKTTEKPSIITNQHVFFSNQEGKKLEEDYKMSKGYLVIEIA